MQPEIIGPGGGPPPVTAEQDAGQRVVQELNKIRQPQPSANEPNAVDILTDVLTKMTEMAGLLSGLQGTMAQQQRFIEQNYDMLHALDCRVNQLELMSKMAQAPTKPSPADVYGLPGQIVSGAQHVQTTEEVMPEPPKGWPKPENVDFDTVLVPPEDPEDSQNDPEQRPTTDPTGPACPTGEPGEPGPAGP